MMKQQISLTTITLCTSLIISQNASAGLVADGNYNLVVLPTPTFINDAGEVKGDFGSQATGWNSSFTFGTTPHPGSNPMNDNGVIADIPPVGPRGSSIGGDGYSGILGMYVNGDNFAINSFAMDAILDTTGGDFLQYADVNANMYGTIDAVGNMILTMEGRLGYPVELNGFHDKKWNYSDSPVHLDSGGTAGWAPFTTGTMASAVQFGLPKPVTGEAVINIGDINGDFIDDYSLILVSASRIGTDWTGFTNVTYTEVWNAQILSAVPIPGAVWLFGSGLLGFAGIARRRS